MKRKVFVIGVGVTDFTRPDSGRDYLVYGKEAVVAALNDARITYKDIEQAMCSCMLGDTMYGQRVLYQMGATGIPIHNVSAAFNALFLAKQFIQGGIADCILTVGFEKMRPGPLIATYGDRTPSLDQHIIAMDKISNICDAPLLVQIFGNAGAEYMKKYGATEVHLAKIAAKNLKHALKNPIAQNKRNYSIEEVLNSRRIYGVLTKLECSPTTDGASAAIFASEDFVISHQLQDKAVEIIDMEMVTDLPGTFDGNSLMKIAGFEMTAEAAKRIYCRTGISPKEIDVVELHDCFATNELITYEGLKLCEEGRAGKFVDEGQNTYGGRVIVNPSGGLIGKGHPLGATGIAQCAELVWQLRGEAGARQVRLKCLLTPLHSRPLLFVRTSEASAM